MAVTPNLTVLRPLNQFSIIFQVKNLQVVSSVKQRNLFISLFIIKSLAIQSLVFHKRGNGWITIFVTAFFFSSHSRIEEANIGKPENLRSAKLYGLRMFFSTKLDSSVILIFIRDLDGSPLRR